MWFLPDMKIDHSVKEFPFFMQCPFPDAGISIHEDISNNKTRHNENRTISGRLAG